MHKAMMRFFLLVSLPLAAMEITHNVPEKEIDDVDPFANLRKITQQEFQIKLWLLQHQEVPIQRIKLHEDTTREITGYMHQAIKKKKEKNAQQYMPIKTFEQNTGLYKSVPCQFEGKRWNEKTERFEPTGMCQPRYLVQDLNYNVVYKKRLKSAELPLKLQKAIKEGRAQAVAKNKFFYGDFSIANDDAIIDVKNKIKIYANKDILDIYTEELNKFYNFDLSLREDRYIAINYASKFLQGLPNDSDEYEELISVTSDEQEELYVCKTGKQYYLFGVLFDQDAPDKDDVYSIEVNDKVYKLADKLLAVDQAMLDRMENKIISSLNGSSSELSSESSNEESEDIGDKEL